MVTANFENAKNRQIQLEVSIDMDLQCDTVILKCIVDVLTFKFMVDMSQTKSFELKVVVDNWIITICGFAF